MYLRYYKAMLVVGLSLAILSFCLVYNSEQITIDLSCHELNRTDKYCTFACGADVVSMGTPDLTMRFEVFYSNRAKIVDALVGVGSNQSYNITFELPRRDYLYEAWAFAYSGLVVGSTRDWVGLYC